MSLMTQTFARLVELILALPIFAMFWRPSRPIPSFIEAEPERPATAGPAPLTIETVPDDPMRYAFEECGLPVHKLRPDFDVASTGKLNEVIHHLAHHRGKT